jgi:hypothetical protein
MNQELSEALLFGEILGKLERSKSHQLVTNSRHERSHPSVRSGRAGGRGALSALDQGYAGGLCINEFPRIHLLGSSLSSNAARRLFQICHEALEDGIPRCAALSTAALPYGICPPPASCDSRPCPERPIWLGRWRRPCAGRYLEVTVSGQRESLCLTTSPLEASTGAVPE